MKTRVRASAVPLAEGRLLLVRLRDPVTGEESLYPPGGAVEPGERPEETARRETLEETGVRVVVDPARVLVERYPFTWAGVDYDVTTHYFAATPESHVAASRVTEVLPPVVDAEYNLGALWVPIEEALRAIHPRVVEAVSAVLRL